MYKKSLSLILIVALLLSVFTVSVSARASYYFSSYSASLHQGSSSGKISVSYTVVSSAGTMNLIGISRIQVYKSNGTLYKTITGSTSNGLLKSSAFTTAGTYSISCASGTSYYCIVTVYASNSSGSDSRTIQTGTVTCP